MKSFGVLAATALAVACLSTAVASAATQPTVGTKAQWQVDIGRVSQPGTGCYRASYPELQWQPAKCLTAPRIPLLPGPVPRSAGHAGPDLVGNGTDYSARVPGLISAATGTFTNVSPGITERGYVDNGGSLTANAFSLQLNTQFFAGSPACHGSSNPSGCEAWQQFVYTFNGCSVSCIFMQYWLINYDATCPSGWFAYSHDCYTNSPAAYMGGVTASQLASTRLSGSAHSGGQDGVSLSVGSGQASSVTNSDGVVDLAAHWNTTEWGVFGDGGGGEADFGANTTLQAQTSFTDTTSAAPACVAEGFTGETNNLSLTSTPTLGAEPSPTMASRQTNGATGTASCSGVPAAPYEVAFQANTGSLWSVGAVNHGAWNLGMMAGTSPSVALMTSGAYEYAFQANTGSLWTVGGSNHGAWNLGMMKGTSPAITALAHGGYEVAFQANTGDLWTVGNAGDKNWGLGMMKGTSPSIAGLTNGSYEVAFQANTGDLWTVGSSNHGTWRLGMMKGTSPSITGLTNGSYEVAFQANTSSLWTVGFSNHGAWNLGMKAGTSPSIAHLTNGSYEVAFQANTSSLWTVGSSNQGAWNLGMMAGTSPSIVGLSNGSYEVAFQANTGSLWTVGAYNRGAWNLGMMKGTSPSIAI